MLVSVFAALLCLVLSIDSIAESARISPGTGGAARIDEISPRTLPPIPPPDKISPEQYCNSIGGSTLYESISSASISVNPGGGTMTITVQLYIANPTGCTSGNPCPEYDNSPEFVNAWIDWDEDDDWYDANERVMNEAATGYLNINYQGTMTVVAQSTIPAGIAGARTMRVNLGWGFDPNDPCEYQWTWGNVLDLEVNFANAAVTSISVINDVAIRDVNDPIWRRVLNPDGSVSDDTPPGDRVIAGAASVGSFTVQAQLSSVTATPPWSPNVEYMWSINGEAGSGAFSGWQGNFPVTLPRRVGTYTLTMFYTIRDPNNNVIRRQTVMMPVHITLNAPLASVSPPKLRWLEKACQWSAGATNEATVLNNLNNGIYQLSGGIYEDHSQSWEYFLDNVPGAQVNCVTYSSTWNNLCKVLGIGGTSVRQTRGANNMGFVTLPATALDGKTGNAYARAAGGPPYDKWVFGMHQVGEKGTYWDPTMGDTYAGILDFIKWNITGTTPAGDFAADGGHEVHWVGGLVGATWTTYDYNPAVKYAGSGNKLALGNAIFSGSFSDGTSDDDDDGYYDRLNATAGVLVYNPGLFAIRAMLVKGDTVISTRPSWDAVQPSMVDTQLAPGASYIDLSFSGEEIYRSGVDGPYTIKWILIDSINGLLDSAAFTTTVTPDHSDYGELPIRTMVDEMDIGVDDDLDGAYDFLRVYVTADISRNGTYAMGGALRTDSIEIATASSIPQTSGPGLVEFELDFSGPVIREKGIWGPYDLSVWVEETGAGQVGAAVFTTETYDPNDFDEFPVKLDGPLDTSLIDLGMDGLYDTLVFTIRFSSDVAVPLQWTGWLTDTLGNGVATAHAMYGYGKAGAGPALMDSVALGFAGHDIYSSGLNGPYDLSYLVVSADSIGTVGFHDVFLTEPYTFEMFQPPPPALVALIGDFTDAAYDTTGDELYDYLAIEFSVSTIDTGNIVGNARLTDGSGGDIQWSSGYVHCPQDDICRLAIKFDGSEIYAHHENGPFLLKDLIIYHTGDPDELYRDLEQHETQYYEYAEFSHAYVCGDADGSMAVNVADAVYIINYVFKGGPAPDPLCVGDANGDGFVNIGDAVYLVNYIFKGGAPPVADCCS